MFSNTEHYADIKLEIGRIFEIEDMIINQEGMNERAEKIAKYLLGLPDGTAVSAGDVGGFLAGYFGTGDEPEDEIEIISYEAK